jgi:hypothetical protein
VALNVHNKEIYAGLFTDIIEAAKEYDRLAKYYYGSFARLNFPDAK